MAANGTQGWRRGLRILLLVRPCQRAPRLGPVSDAPAGSRGPFHRRPPLMR
jgi:hypothetical protein